MKKAIVVIVSLGLPFALSLPAFGQSHLSLSGVIDEGLDFTNHANANGKASYQFESGYAQSNIFTLSGEEDLGGGKKILFVKKTSFDINSGLAVPARSYLGLSDAKLGTVTLGRQYDSVLDYLAPVTANGNWGGVLLSHPFDNDNTDGSFLVNNAIKYASQDLAGFQFGGLAGLSNDTRFANDRLFSLGAQYTHGPLLIAAAYLQSDNPGAEGSGATPEGNANFTAARLRIFGAGINYQIGSATLGFVYSNTNVVKPVSTSWLPGTPGDNLPPDGAANAFTLLRFQNFEFSGSYQITPSFFVGAQYVYTQLDADTAIKNSTLHVHSAGLMADYNLSKRTDVYLQGAYEKVAGDKTGTVLDYAYITGAGGVSSTSSQMVLRAAIRHRF